MRARDMERAATTYKAKGKIPIDLTPNYNVKVSVKGGRKV